MATTEKPVAKAPEKAPDAPQKSDAGDVAEFDTRARGSEISMSDRDAGNSYLAAQNQVPQEGALVTDPPQPEPPKDNGREPQDKSNELSRSTYPENRRVGHGVAPE